MGAMRDSHQALNVLYEDPWLMAVDKPAGIIVHGDGTATHTLTGLVARHLQAQGRDRTASEVQPLQRLDRDTTGIVLFSLSKETQPAFDRLIAERAVRKRYLAIVDRRFPAAKTMQQSIGRDRHDSRRMRVSRTGKTAHTEVTRIAYTASNSHGPARSLLSVDLHTGRKHQIRVHLSHAGFPIVGDVLYGGTRSTAGLMLHAAEMSFSHPVTGEPICIRAPYPERFENLFQRASLPSDL